MSERIFLGMAGGRQLLRMTPPGVDASNIASRSSFSSDGDFLKVHTVIDANLRRDNNYNWGYFTFPALGYIPICFLSVTDQSLNRVFFPNDRNPATTEMNNFWQWIVQDGQAWVYMDTPSSAGYNYRARIIVFKNPANGYISA